MTSENNSDKISELLLEEKSQENKDLKKIKKFLTNRKQHDKISKLSETAQVSETHKSVLHLLGKRTLITEQ